MEIVRHISGQLILYRDHSYVRLTEREAFNIIKKWHPKLPDWLIDFIIRNMQVGYIRPNQIDIQFEYKGKNFKIVYSKGRDSITVYLYHGRYYMFSMFLEDVKSTPEFIRILEEFIDLVSNLPTPYFVWSIDRYKTHWVVHLRANLTYGTIFVEAEIPGNYRLEYQPRIPYIGKVPHITRGGYVSDVQTFFKILKDFYEEVKNIKPKQETITRFYEKPKEIKKPYRVEKIERYELRWNPLLKRFEWVKL